MDLVARRDSESESESESADVSNSTPGQLCSVSSVLRRDAGNCATAVHGVCTFGGKWCVKQMTLKATRHSPVSCLRITVPRQGDIAASVNENG